MAQAPKRIKDGLKATLKVSKDINNTEVVAAVAEIERRLKKKKMSGKLITYCDVSSEI